MDYRLSDKDSLFGSMSWGNTNKTSVPPFPGALDNSGFNGAGELDLSRNGTGQLHARLEADRGFGNPRQLHPPGDLARRRQPR